MIADAALRLATPLDAACIAGLSRDLIEHGLPWRWRPERVARAIASRDTQTVVVGGPGALSAFGVMRLADEEAHLLLFAVRADCQRCGIGSSLLGWLEASARTAGIDRIRVETRRDHDAARHFYNEHGYHERWLERAMYARAIDGIRLEKWLRGPSLPPSPDKGT